MATDQEQESAEEWGRRQALAAPPWSDAKWRRVCAILGITPSTSRPVDADPTIEVDKHAD